MLKIEDVYPCPFCGETPDVETVGTCINIDCCVTMSIQKCDYLTQEQRETWSNETYKYSPEAEAHTLDVIIKQWNTRSKPSLKEAIDNITEEEIFAIADGLDKADDFNTWWWNEGSGMKPTEEEVFEGDMETFAKRVAEIAWSNGAYKAGEKK